MNLFILIFVMLLLHYRFGDTIKCYVEYNLPDQGLFSGEKSKPCDTNDMHGKMLNYKCVKHDCGSC
uniref:ShKT domain-containing protein n=1 Tax=Meloidogyne hapla TaxID=6305 RepID=A0A1I8BFV5_MELHA